MSKKSIKLRITFNAPVILTFCLLCTLILVADIYIFPKMELIKNWFCVPGSSKSPVPFNFKSGVEYIKLLTHIFGHADWTHLVSNLSFILLLGPLLEERFGSAILTLMIVVTAVVTGVLNACLIPSPLFGASGIAFMLIILASFTTISKNEIPLSFILVFILFLGSEIFLKSSGPDISVLAHVAGGLCGSMFGFLIAPKSARTKKSKPSKTDSPFSEREPQVNDSSSDETVVGTINI